MLDKAVERKQIDYHHRCKNILLSHLCYADNLLVFTDGTKRLIEGILRIFKEFESCSGLKVSLEKYILYSACINENAKEDKLATFPFSTGSLLVRY